MPELLFFTMPEAGVAAGERWQWYSPVLRFVWQPEESRPPLWENVMGLARASAAANNIELAKIPAFLMAGSLTMNAPATFRARHSPRQIRHLPRQSSLNLSNEAALNPVLAGSNKRCRNIVSAAFVSRRRYFFDFARTDFRFLGAAFFLGFAFVFTFAFCCRFTSFRKRASRSMKSSPTRSLNSSTE